MDFAKLSQMVKDQFDRISCGDMFVTNCDPDALWELYLNSFPSGTNEVYRGRREYDCSTCRHFVKRLGGVVAIRKGKVETVWDIKTNDSTFQPVVEALSEYVRSCAIKSVFLTSEQKIGAATTHEKTEHGVRTWTHFYAEIPAHLRVSTPYLGTKIAEANSTVDVFKRSLQTITLEAVDIVLELIAQGSIYRAEAGRRFAEQKCRRTGKDVGRIRDGEPCSPLII